LWHNRQTAAGNVDGGYGCSGPQLSRSAQYHDVGLVSVQLQMIFQKPLSDGVGTAHKSIECQCSVCWQHPWRRTVANRQQNGDETQITWSKVMCRKYCIKKELLVLRPSNLVDILITLAIICHICNIKYLFNNTFGDHHLIQVNQLKGYMTINFYSTKSSLLISCTSCHFYNCLNTRTLMQHSHSISEVKFPHSQWLRWYIFSNCVRFDNNVFYTIFSQFPFYMYANSFLLPFLLTYNFFVFLCFCKIYFYSFKIYKTKLISYKITS